MNKEWREKEKKKPLKRLETALCSSSSTQWFYRRNASELSQLFKEIYAKTAPQIESIKEREKCLNLFFIATKYNNFFFIRFFVSVCSDLVFISSSLANRVHLRLYYDLWGAAISNGMISVGLPAHKLICVCLNFNDNTCKINAQMTHISIPIWFGEVSMPNFRMRIIWLAQWHFARSCGRFNFQF